MPTLRNWLSAHEAGHITYIEMHSSLINYAYIDDSVEGGGIAELLDDLKIKDSALESPASGAAGEVAYYLNEVVNEGGNRISMGQFARGVISRTHSDRELFYKNMDYDGLVKRGEVDPKEIHFIKWAKNMVYDKYIIKEMPMFNSIRVHLDQRGFIGRSVIDAIKAKRTPTEFEIASDYDRIPKSIRQKIRSVNVD